jgi:histidine ammonia-lyase
MGSIAARKAVEILRNVEHIIAIELLCAAQGIDFRGPGNLGKGMTVAYSLLRKHVPMLREDRVLSSDIEATVELIRSEQLTNAVKEIVDLED